MRTKGNFNKALLLAATIVTPSASVFAQLDSTGFPLEVGNKWFYRYQNMVNGQYTALHVRVKQITDTTQSGERIVRVSRLGVDTTLSMEYWTMIGGNLFVDTTLLYDSTLTRDTTWTITGGGLTDTYTLLLRRVVLFGFNRRCQIRQHITSYTFGSSSIDRRTALGIGWYYNYSGTSTIQSTWNTSYSLIGFERNGVLFGDTVLTSVENESSSRPSSCELSQNYPNPFNPLTTIEYSIQKSGWVDVIVRDLLGRTVSTLVAETQLAGMHRVSWVPTNVASGVYVCTLTFNAQSSSRRLLYIK